MQPEISSVGITKLNVRLKQAEINLDAEQIADILWLAVQIDKVEETSSPETPVKQRQTFIDSNRKTPASPSPTASAHLPSFSPHKSKDKTVSEGIPFQAPAAPALRQTLALARALRPLMRKVPSQTKTVIDEEETVTQIVEKKIWTPILKPAPERWLDLALVVEESRSTVIWKEIIAEFQRLTELQGAFRYVRTWGLKTNHDGEIELFPKGNFSANKQRFCSPKELLDPAGRRLILLISDCISPIWRQSKIHDLVKLWSNAGSLAIVQLLPERLWGRTALGAGFPIQLSALVPGVANSKLVVDGLPVWTEVDRANSLKLPVVTLEPDSLKQWSRVVAGVGNTQTAGILLELSLIASLPEVSSTAHDQLSAVDLVKRFRTTASPTARRLAGLMAAVPVSLPVVDLIQATLLPESMQVHVAEVFMSGLLQPVSSQGEIVQYEFVEGVRELLLDSVITPDVETVLETVSQYIANKLGISIKNFMALLSADSKWDQATKQQIMPFAQITTQVLYSLGGEYAALAEDLERSSSQSSDASTIPQRPPLPTFECEVVIGLGGRTEASPDIELEPFDFEVATIELKQTGWFRRKLEPIIHRHQHQAYGFSQDLGNGVELEMVAIPKGSFIMGSPETEEGHKKNESPQHQVTVKSFFMGKYPVTQAQWQAVAALPQVNRKLDPNPSRFNGKYRPVERVSWDDAVEFCERLSQYTKRPYRLPSEAEWEYACRAGTTTPFHFGETITTDLANYDSNYDYSYGFGSKGKSVQETTPVGRFDVANNFGLYDMHGNVWEWCADHWHSNYKGAPRDGSVWQDEPNINNDNYNKHRLLRGGCWVGNPEHCRSGSRHNSDPALRHYVNIIGFRVVCGCAWIR
ncbi:MAG: SUMF1/EgtB/PvdO family nonheme iron enzyme [Moorea sp. SIO4A1]|nr:SUMF1/EgtB/PvdO family nonheme iron enzyme [Moorena sp. SIO4A1]